MPRRKSERAEEFEILTEEEKSILGAYLEAWKNLTESEGYKSAVEREKQNALIRSSEAYKSAVEIEKQNALIRSEALERWRERSKEALPNLWRFLGAEGLKPESLPAWRDLTTVERRVAIEQGMPFAEIDPGITLTTVAQRAWDAAANQLGSLRCEICARTIEEITERPNDDYALQSWRAGVRARALEVEMRLHPDRPLSEETRRDLYQQALRSGLSVDHRIPLARGGTHTWDNVALVHFRCNVRKGDR